MDTYIPAKRYIKSMFEIESDLWVWDSIIEKSISEFEKESNIDCELFSSIFKAYNIDSISNHGFLKAYLAENKNIKISTLKTQKAIFFRWVMNLSLLRAYNAIEIFISSAIVEKYLGKEITISQFKELSMKLNIEIKSYFEMNNLGKVNSKNNRHVIKYLRHKSLDVDNFLKQKIRIDLNTNWEGFFEFVSILRNAIAHNGMILNQDTLNNIKSSAKDVYERYFSNEVMEEDAIFLNPNPKQFINVLTFMNDFAINMVKFIKEEPDLKFMSFY